VKNDVEIVEVVQKLIHKMMYLDL